MAARKQGSIRVTSLELVGDADWDALVVQGGRPFRFSHRAVAGRALERAYPSYRYTPCHVRYSDGTSLLCPLVRIERRLDAMSMAVGMPIGLEGTPIVLEGEARGIHVEMLFKELENCGSLELFGGAGGSPPQVGQVQSLTTHALDLSAGFGAVWGESFTAKTRNMCRKAERGGVIAELDCSPAAVSGFASLHSKAAESWESGGPPRSDDLFATMLASGEAELWVARVEDRVIAGALLLRGSDDVCYWAGAMDRDYRAVAPSNAVLRAAIEHACESGINYLDFGASTGLPGVEAFKRSFGAKLREYHAVALASRRFRQLEWTRRRLATVRAER
jgi:hypothetical protein